MPLGADFPGGAKPLVGQAGGNSANAVALGLKELHPEQIRAVVIPMYATLDASTQSGYDTYRVPTTHDLVIEEIRPHVVLMDPTNSGSLTIVAANYVANNIADKILSRAINCLWDLKNVDREQKVVDSHSSSLGMLMEALGGSPINFGSTPLKVIAGESVRLDVRYASVAEAPLIAGSTQYGITLVGKLVRVARS